MPSLMLPFSPRFVLLTSCTLASAATAIAIAWWPGSLEVLLLPLIAFGGLTLLGVRDLLQTHHSILRNYPIAAHLRFLFEEIRPEMRQYFFEGDKDGTPFSRDTRALVYQRAKMQLDKRPFSTQHEVYGEHFEWM